MFYDDVKDRVGRYRVAVLARLPRTAVGLRQARAGFTLAIARPEDSLASNPAPEAQHRHPDWLSGLVRHHEETLLQRPEFELPDADGFLAGLILRLLRGGNQSTPCGTKGRQVGSASDTAQPTRKKRPVSAKPAGCVLLNMVAEPLQELLFVELAQRQAQIISAQERTS